MRRVPSRSRSRELERCHHQSFHVKLPLKMSDAEDRKKEPSIADQAQAISATRIATGVGGGGQIEGTLKKFQHFTGELSYRLLQAVPQLT